MVSYCPYHLTACFFEIQICKELLHAVELRRSLLAFILSFSYCQTFMWLSWLAPWKSCASPSLCSHEGIYNESRTAGSWASHIFNKKVSKVVVPLHTSWGSVWGFLFLRVFICIRNCQTSKFLSSGESEMSQSALKFHFMGDLASFQMLLAIWASSSENNALCLFSNGNIVVFQISS